MKLLRLLGPLLLCLPAAAPVLAQPAIAPVITVDHGPNTAAQQRKHYVVLVSLDGFRYDYAAKYAATHLLAMAKQGASAPDGMLPSYPSLTFPNHYTLVTGLYPEHHGIVAMSFYDPARKQRYAFNDPATSSDGTWYGGTPLWVLAEQQGMRAACFFWPGSEAAIDGVRPSFYLHFDDKFPDENRIDQVTAWLKLPPAKRPHFITLYYSNVDHAGHATGPGSRETAAAVKHVDELIGRLYAQLNALKLPIDLIVVSDHGMASEQGPWIELSQFANLSNMVTAGSLVYPQTDADAATLYQQLKIADSRFKVYRRAQLPSQLHYDANARTGDPVIVATGPYAVRAQAGSDTRPPNAGVHGYDPLEMPEMKAIFYAAGPDIRPGVSLKPFENVNVYPLIAAILGLNTPPVDGSLNVLSGILATQPKE